MLFKEIFHQTCLNHLVELEIAKLHKNGKIKIPIYLSVGQEHIPAVLSKTGDWTVFTQHRCHSYYLSFGGDPKQLIKELTDGDMEGSASLSIKGKLFGHSGLLGDNIPIGIGYAHATNKPTLIHAGDAAVEEDYALASLGYAATNKVPALIVVEDNNLSILTKKETRRSWSIVDVAKSFGLEAINIEDDPETIYDAVIGVKLPALININTCRNVWHCGSGSDGDPAWNRYEMMKKQFPGIEEEVWQNLEIQLN